MAFMRKTVEMKIEVANKIAVVSPKTMHHGVDLRRVIAWAHKMQIEGGIHRMRLEFGIALYEQDVKRAVLLVTMPDAVYVMSNGGVERLDQFAQPVVETTVDAQIGRWEKV